MVKVLSLEEYHLGILSIEMLGNHAGAFLEHAVAS